MEDVFDVTWQGSATSGGTSVEAELASLIDVVGLSLFDDPERLAAQLSQACPGASRQVDAVVAALRSGVPDRLRDARDDGTLATLLRRIARDLRAGSALDEGWATWAVRAWAHALALPTAGLDEATATDERSAAGGRSSGPAVPGRAATNPFARIDTPAARGDRASAIATATRLPREPKSDGAPRPGGAQAVGSTAAVEPAHRGRGRQEPVFAARPAGPLDEAPRRADDAVGGPDVLIEPLFADDEVARVATRPVGPIGLVASDSGIFPTPLVDWSATGPRPASPEPSLRGTPTLPGPTVTVAASPPLEVPPPPGERRRIWPLAVGGAALAVAAIAALTYWTTQRGPSRDDVVARAAPTVPSPAATSIPPSPSSAADVAPPSAGASARPDSVDARTSPPSPTDAAEPPLVFAPPAAGTASGSATGATAAPTGDATTPPAASTSAAGAGSASGTGGSTAGTVPVIGRIDVPAVVEGAPFTVAVHVAGDARDIVSLERRIVSSQGIWPRSGAVTTANGLRAVGNETLLVPFRAMDAPASATVQFTAIGRDGTHSAPKAATISVAGATPWTTSRIASGADESSRDAAASCTPSTCGTLVEARELIPEFDTSTAVYQLVVRTDDRQTRAFTAPYRLQTGSRVRLADGRVVPAGADAR